MIGTDMHRKSASKVCQSRRGAALSLSMFGTLIAALLLLAVAKAQEKPAAPETQAQLDRLIYSLKGPDLFQAYCAACHGGAGRGDGPVAAELKTMPADLTVLSRSNGGQFPAAHVRKVITGEEMAAAHGTREMPIWGPIFHQIENDQDFGNVRIENLTKYLQSIQRK